LRFEQEKLGYLEGWASIAINTLLFGLKFWTGRSVGSVAMIADSWHTLSDTLTSVVVILGFWITAKPADKDHPFGHARAEQIAAVIIGVMLAVVGSGFVIQSVKRLVNRTTVTFSLLGIVVFAVSIVIKEGLAQFAFWVGRKTGARSVAADGWHHRSDAIASALIVVGALLGGALWWMDGALGIAVSLLILFAAFEIFRDAASPLLGEAPDASLENAIKTLIRREYPEADDIHHLHVHRYGNKAEITVHIRVNPSMSVGTAHEITRKIEKRLRQELSLNTTVHIEPLTQ
jgi:cation diffusion facilitator family transporter